MALNPDHYAIVIGIDAYPFLLRLRASAKDAAKFQAWLLADDGGGLPAENIATIISPPTLPPPGTSARPIQDEIDDALIRFGVLRDERVGARLYFYFAGHAFGPRFNDIGMLMANAGPTLLNRNIGLQHYREYFHDQSPFDEVVYILDCCRDRDGQPSTRPPSMVKKPPNGQVKQVQDFVVLAAAYGEKAWQANDTTAGERRGLLTAAILEGLQGAARDAQGRITASKLSEYVRTRVPELAKKENREKNLQQEPEADPPNQEIVFGPVTAVNQVNVRIIAPPHLNGELVVLSGSGLTEVARRSAADVTKDKPPWELNLARNSLYLVQHTGSTRETTLDTRKVKEQPYVIRFPRPR